MHVSDRGCSDLRCCKFSSYELATGHQLADIVEDLGYVVGQDGIYGLGEEDLATLWSESRELQQLATRVDCIETLHSCLKEHADLAAAYIHLAAAKHKTDLGNHFDRLAQASAGQLLLIVNDPFIQSIIPVTDEQRSQQEREASATAGSGSTRPNAPAGPEENMEDGDLEVADNELLMQKIEAEQSVRIEIDRLQAQLKKHQEHENEMRVVLESTNERMATIESQLQVAVADCEVAASEARSYVDHRRRKHHQQEQTILEAVVHDPLATPNAGAAGRNILRYTPATATSNAVSVPAEPSAQLPGVIPEEDESLEDASMEDSFETMEEGATFFPMVRTPRDDSADLNGDGVVDEEEKMLAAIQIAKAEKDRLERMLVKAQNGMKKSAGESHRTAAEQAEYEKRIAAARARRAAKEDIPLDSDSGTSGLLSPRDKALRATLKKKEESKKEKAKAKKQNGAAAKE